MSQRRARVGRVVIGLVAGMMLGGVLGSTNAVVASRVSDILSPVGTLWINSVRMTVVPLVVALLFVSVATAGGEGSGAVTHEGTAALATFVGLLVFAAATTCLIAPSLVDQM